MAVLYFTTQLDAPTEGLCSMSFSMPNETNGARTWALATAVETMTWALLSATHSLATAVEEKMQKATAVEKKMQEQLRLKFLKDARYLGCIECPTDSPSTAPSILVRDVASEGMCGWALLALHGGSAPPRGDER